MKSSFVAPVGFYVACRCIVGLCGGWWCWWGVSIIREWGKDKANLLEKHKKNLTRELKKSYTRGNRGSEKIL